MTGSQYNDTRLAYDTEDCQESLNPVGQTPILLPECLHCIPAGRNCYRCRHGGYTKAVKHPLEFSNISYKSESVSRRKRAERARVGLLLGMGVNDIMYGHGRMFVVTQGVVDKGISASEPLHNFLMAFRYKYGEVEYSWVRHHPPSGKRYQDHKGQWRVSQGRYNLHLIVFNTGFINPRWLGCQCERSFQSRASGLEYIWDYGATANYLSEYLSKHDFIKVGYSSNWLFPKWREFCKAYEYQLGYYPPIEYLYRAKMLGRGILREQFKELQEVGFFERREYDKRVGLHRRFKFNGIVLSRGGR